MKFINYKSWFFCATLVCIGGGACSSELFVDNKAPSLLLRDKILVDHLIGGYPIPLNYGNLQYAGGSVSETNGGVKLGTLMTFYNEGSNIVGFVTVTANLNSGGNLYWTGSPCSPNHLVVRNLPNGREDHCLTIDPIEVNIGNVPTTMLELKITNTAGSGRYYVTNIRINLNLLGVKDTRPGEWTEDFFKINPYRKKFIENVTGWGEQILNASIKASGFSKSQDVFKDLPGIKSLLPVPNELKNANLSVGFFSALEDLNQKPNYKAMAFTTVSSVMTPHNEVWNMPNQEDADKRALAACLSNSANPKKQCTLYKPGMVIE